MRSIAIYLAQLLTHTVLLAVRHLLHKLVALTSFSLSAVTTVFPCRARRIYTPARGCNCSSTRWAGICHHLPPDRRNISRNIPYFRRAGAGAAGASTRHAQSNRICTSHRLAHSTTRKRIVACSALPDYSRSWLRLAHWLGRPHLPQPCVRTHTHVSRTQYAVRDACST
jgi:hypothetical protein